MTPEREAGPFAKIDTLVEMVRDVQAQQRDHADRLSRIEGRMSDMPTAHDFGRLEGRVAEMSARLPTTIGYAPPKPAA